MNKTMNRDDLTTFLTQPPQQTSRADLTKDVASTQRSKKSKEFQDKAQWDISHWNSSSKIGESGPLQVYADTTPYVNSLAAMTDRTKKSMQEQMNIQQNSVGSLSPFSNVKNMGSKKSIGSTIHIDDHLAMDQQSSGNDDSNFGIDMDEFMNQRS